jgi:hypothetical protein
MPEKCASTLITPLHRIELKITFSRLLSENARDFGNRLSGLMHSSRSPDQAAQDSLLSGFTAANYGQITLP